MKTSLARSTVTVSLLVLLSGTTGGAPGDFSVEPGFITGSKYRKFDQAHRETYLVDVIDGYLGSIAFKADQNLIPAFNTCISDMDSEQITAIVDKYMAQHPEYWNQGMNVLVIQSILAVCPALRAAVNAAINHSNR
jgi:hypothetical protein